VLQRRLSLAKNLYRALMSTILDTFYASEQDLSWDRSY